MVGIRKPSASKSFKARTTGRINRAVKRAGDPLYGKKGTGFVTNPKRSVKNAVYHRTSVGGLSSINSSHSRSATDDSSQAIIEIDKKPSHWIIGIVIELVAIFTGSALLGWIGACALGGFIGGILICWLI